MFTGLIEEVGLVQHARREGGITTLAIGTAPGITDLRIGESVAVDGTCLTVTKVESSRFEVELSEETLARTTLGTLRPGHPVNLERPLLAVDRLGGHIVTGHVDGIGTILELRQTDGSWWLSIAYPRDLRPFIVPKGSIAVDGISLTVASLNEPSFGVAIIPHTFHHTTLRIKQVGGLVNLETDLLGKYVIRYLDGLGLSGRKPALTETFLREMGFA